MKINGKICLTLSHTLFWAPKMTPQQNIRQGFKNFFGTFFFLQPPIPILTKKISPSLENLNSPAYTFDQSKFMCRYPKTKLPERKMLITSLTSLNKKIYKLINKIHYTVLNV